MNAADVLAERIPFWQERNGVLGRDEARFLAEDLLAHGEQGVAILPDGTLIDFGPIADLLQWFARHGTPSRDAELRRLVTVVLLTTPVPLSAEAGDTDG